MIVQKKDPNELVMQNNADKSYADLVKRGYENYVAGKLIFSNYFTLQLDSCVISSVLDEGMNDALTFSLKIAEIHKQMDSKKSTTGDSKWQENADQSLWPSCEIYPAGMWNYGLALNDKPMEEQFQIIKKSRPGDNFPFTQETVPFMLKEKGKIIPEWISDKHGLCDLLPQSPVSVSSKEQEIKLIPMGATRLRISSFPVVM